MKVKLLIITSIFLGTGVLAENFIIKKTPKVSQQKLKEQAGNDCADFLHYSAPTIKKIAHIQEFCINEVDDLIQNNKKGILHNASKEMLGEWHAKIDQLNHALTQLHNELDAVCSFIHENRSLPETISKKNK